MLCINIVIQSAVGDVVSGGNEHTRNDLCTRQAEMGVVMIDRIEEEL